MGQKQLLGSCGNMFVAGLNSEYQYGISNKTFQELVHLKVFENKNIIKIVCGENFTFVLTDKNELFGTGCNFSGVLSINQTSTTSFFHIPIIFKILDICCNRSILIILTKENKFYWSGGDISIVNSPLNKQFTSILDWNLEFKNCKIKFLESCCVGLFFIIVTSANRIYFSGVNCSGQFGNGQEKHSTSINIISSVIVTDCNQLFTAGNNYYFQLGHSNGEKQNVFLKPNVEFQGKSIKLVKCGPYYTIVYLENGDLYACGQNDLGQLGNGKRQMKMLFHKVLTNKSIVSLHCGFQTTLFITRENNIYRFGSNKYGELFIGKTSEPFYTQPMKSNIQRKLHLYGISGGKGYTILYQQKNNFNGEIYLRYKNGRMKNKSYLMYRSIPDHYYFIYNLFKDIILSNEIVTEDYNHYFIDCTFTFNSHAIV
ncbi:hypothetical protein ABK040_005731 [Willaertia magna]